MADEEVKENEEQVEETVIAAQGGNTPVEEEPESQKSVKFFFPKNAKKSYRTPNLNVKAENNVYILDPANPKYEEILIYLREHKDNNANGGRVFVELSADIDGETNRGILLDKLIEMDVQQLRKICGGSLELEIIHSKGQLIDLYLTQQEE